MTDVEIKIKDDFLAGEISMIQAVELLQTEWDCSSYEAAKVVYEWDNETKDSK